MADKNSRRHSASADTPSRMRPNEAPDGELHLEAPPGDGRAGDRRSHQAERDEFPAKRVREAGLTAGSKPGSEPTADDASPETLIPEDRPAATDRALTTVEASEIGAGTGLDEAELAQVKPVRRPQRNGSTEDRGPGRMHSRNAARRSSQGQG